MFIVALLRGAGGLAVQRSKFGGNDIGKERVGVVGTEFVAS